MMEKIEWYQEVLEIEPSSKVFFPLAKLLSGNNQAQEAVAVLRQGLDRHPEFFEARLMLIDLLQQEGDMSGSLGEVQKLSAKLTAYPGFWEAWAGSAAAGTDKDMAVALRLMATFLRHSDISWGEIISRGLAAFVEAPARAGVMQEAPPAKAPISQIEPVESVQFVPASLPETADATGKELVEDAAALLDDDLGGLTAQEEISAPLVSESATPPAFMETEADEDDGDDEQFSLRTKTMATVLAEQGDYAGAKDIYEEILASTTDPDAQADLAERIADLANKLKSGHAPVQAEESDAAPEQGKNKLIQVLERLAGRLENRADEA